MTPNDLIARAEEQIAGVEAFLRAQMDTDEPLLQNVCDYVLEAGGKRLRPGLAVLSGRLLGASLEELLPAAAAVEMIHTATLLHDDIMDESPMRRGRVTVCRRWDPVIAVFAGDFILSRAFTLLSGYGRPDILGVFSEVTTKLCAGEVLQATRRHDLGITREDYLEIIDCKTAHFLSCCCRVGGMVAGARSEALDALSRYGEQIGLVFQMTDDLLDYVGDKQQTGKEVGADYREGKYTIPVILALSSSGEPAGRLRSLLASGDLSDSAFLEARAAVLDTGAVERARTFAQACTDAAISALDVLPDCEERDALRRLAVWIASRTA